MPKDVSKEILFSADQRQLKLFFRLEVNRKRFQNKYSNEQCMDIKQWIYYRKLAYLGGSCRQENYKRRNEKYIKNLVHSFLFRYLTIQANKLRTFTKICETCADFAINFLT